jgi:hypothetical protein
MNVTHGSADAARGASDPPSSCIGGDVSVVW